jgi:L-lactate dehydrogenase (cytochrome)
VKAGIGYVVPHMGGHGLEEVFEAVQGPGDLKPDSLWYQIYNIGARKVAEPAVERAWKAGYRVLVVTIENPATFHERVIRGGMRALTSGTTLSTLPHLPQMIARPGWSARYLLAGWRHSYSNTVLDGRILNARDLQATPSPTFSWDDLEWLRKAWAGKIVLKGILREEDARRAVDFGADAIIVSNHGGRTLDASATTLAVLPGIVKTVNGNAEIILDSGIRRGRDVMAALCMGARAVLWGRPSLSALSFGETGVSHALAMLRGELQRNMAALGCPSTADLNGSFLLSEK